MHSEMVSNAEPMQPLHPEWSVKPSYEINQNKQMILQWWRGPKEVVKNGPKRKGARVLRFARNNQIDQ